MIRSASMLLVVVVLSFATTPVRASDRSFALYGGLGGGATLGGSELTSATQPGGRHGAVTGSLDVVWGFHRVLALDVVGDSGFVPMPPTALPESSKGNYWQRIGVGLRLESRRAGVRPYVGLRLVHIHMAPVEVWQDHPVESLAGSSDVGLEHRSGAALAAGVSAGVPFPDFGLRGLAYTRDHLRVFASAELMAVPMGNGPRYFPLGQIGLGWQFR